MVDLQVVPRASRTAVGPVEGSDAAARLRVAVTAPPVEGEANAAVIEALAEALGIKRREVSLVRGEAGRKKTVRIAGLSAATLFARLERPLR